jgi:alpha-ketoglutarate-dependent taurine dioxygenase
MTDAKEYRSLIEQKKGLVFELLRLSNDVELKEGTPEQGADRYADFVEAREELIAKLKALDQEMEAFSGQELAEDSVELRTMLQEIQTMIDQVIRLEPEIQRKALVLSTHFQRRINAVKTQRQEAQSRGEYTKGLRYQKNV